MNVEQAYQALELAELEYTRASLRACTHPDDRKAKRAVTQAVVAGRDAWERYRQVAPPELAAMARECLPSAFLNPPTEETLPGEEPKTL